MIITYFRILIDKQTNEAVQFMTSGAPLYDFKMTDTSDDTGNPVTTYEEWNGVLESATIMRARDLREALNLTVANVVDPPTLKADPNVSGVKIHHMERYIKERYPDDQYKPTSLKLTDIEDPEVYLKVEGTYKESALSGERRKGQDEGTLQEVIARQEKERGT